MILAAVIGLAVALISVVIKSCCTKATTQELPNTIQDKSANPVVATFEAGGNDRHDSVMPSLGDEAGDDAGGDVEQAEKEDEEDDEGDDTAPQAEVPFIPLLIVSACSVAFAHGGNDVANAVGPLAVIVEVYNGKDVTGTPEIHYWCLFLYRCMLFCTVFVSFYAVFVLKMIDLQGSCRLGRLDLSSVSCSSGAIWSLFPSVLSLFSITFSIILSVFPSFSLRRSRTIKTVGQGLCKNLNPAKAFAVQTGAAIAVLGSSALGLPVSTSHCLVGAVVGVSVASKLRGSKDDLDLSVLKRIVMGWVVTIPLAMLVAVLVFLPLRAVFGVGD